MPLEEERSCEIEERSCEIVERSCEIEEEAAANHFRFSSLNCGASTSRSTHELRIKQSILLKTILICDGSGRLRSTSTISLNSPAYTKAVFHQQKEAERKQAHRYILFNCDDVQQYIREHEDIVNSHTGKRKWSKAKSHSNDFIERFETRAMNDDISDFVKGLSRGPNTVAKKFSGYVINGYRFHTRMRDGRCKTQNSGVTVEAITRSFASSKDERPRKDSLTYYGAITDIIELNYYELYKYVLFKCDWFEVKEDNYGMKFVHFDKRCYQEDPFVLATQVHQCFYVRGHLEENRYYVMKRVPRDLFNMGDQSDGGQEFHWGEPSDSSSNPTLPVDDGEVDLVRMDVPATIIDQPSPTLDD
ncbi:hypothetical protein G2W53_010167 [Senna tora]|uniref:DUF4216 domain-containing protein n=1 Tax=Senna tora TaxID=362788 RepID=A0A834WZM9_9FABA|nr:hypothetical protein G2W53_010167 [Senna tora]